MSKSTNNSYFSDNKFRHALVGTRRKISLGIEREMHKVMQDIVNEILYRNRYDNSQVNYHPANQD